MLNCDTSQTFQSIHPPLPDWLTPKRIPRTALEHSPLMEFERGLAEWGTRRSPELECPNFLAIGGYYAGVFHEQLGYTERDFNTAEKVREAIRNGTSVDNDHWWNAHPTEHLEITAYRLGWRLVPLARWAGVKINRWDIPHDVETACRKLAAELDVTWLSLMEMPDRYKNESSRALVDPVLHRAKSLGRAVFEELWQYGELVPSLRPYYREIMGT